MTLAGRAGFVALMLVVGASAGVGAAAAPQVVGKATIASKAAHLRFAAAFQRMGGGYAVVLAEQPVRCAALPKLPADDSLHQRWALISFFAFDHGVPGVGRASGEVDYPVGDAYASISRGISITLAEAGPYVGAVWRGKIVQAPRVVGGERYALEARFSARWCAT